MSETITYNLLPTIEKFHKSMAQYRAIVGPVGSGKTSAAAYEVCWYLPRRLFDKYEIKKTRGVVVRNTYSELRDTTQRTVFEWFPHGQHKVQENIYILRWPYKGQVLEVEMLFRSCDRAEDVKKFKSLEVTWYWGDESIEIAEAIFLMLATRIGRFPKKCPESYGIETTNPPDVESETYSKFQWKCPPPEGSPLPSKQPLVDHVGFWQPPGENVENLPPGYYSRLREAYRDHPDWADSYIDSKPGMIIKGKLVYNNFRRKLHVAAEPLVWCKDVIFRGWDNTGNCPAAVAVQIPTAMQPQVIHEWHTDREGIVDFTRRVMVDSNRMWPDAEYVDYADPAGTAQISKRGGGFTSNATLMEEVGVEVESSEQNFTARRESVEQALGRIDGLLISPTCVRLINGFMGGYHFPEIGTTGTHADAPEKNKWSHVHDGLQYVMVKLFRAKKPRDEHAMLRRKREQDARKPGKRTGY